MESNILLKKAPARILLCIAKGETTITGMSVVTGSIYAYVSQIVNIFEEYGYIESERVGKKRMCKITKKGERVVEIMKEMMEK